MELRNSLNLPFLGALSYCDFYNKSIDEQKQILIKLEIYKNNNHVQFFVFKNLNTYNRLLDIGVDEAAVFSVENKYCYSRFIKYFDVDFVLNADFVKDVYLNMKFDVDCVTEERIEHEKNSVLLDVSKYLNITEKLSFLEKTYYFHFTEIRSINNYLCFYSPELFGFDDWQRFVSSQIYSEPKLIEMHLFNKTNYDTTFLDLSKDWINLNFHSLMMDFVKNEIENLKSYITTERNKVPDTSKQIVLLEAIFSSNKWPDLSATKKGEILSYLLAKSDHNIRKVYSELDKSVSERSNKIKSEEKEINDLFGKFL